MKTKSIKQTISFNAAPIEVYELLMNAKKHAAFTGSKAKMSTQPNGKFEVWDGYCHGYNIELEEGKKIVQAWHFAEDGWPDDHYSICTFVFQKAPKGTKLSFTQTGIPEHKAKALKSGWKEYYWSLMTDYFKNKNGE
ncbi:MAG: SRPBCC family protein [Chitinophagales bacterium]